MIEPAPLELVRHYGELRSSLALPRAPLPQPQPLGPAPTCQWWLGRQAGVHKFCGKPSVDGYSWCPEHRAVVLVSVPRVRLAA